MAQGTKRLLALLLTLLLCLALFPAAALAEDEEGGSIALVTETEEGEETGEEIGEENGEENGTIQFADETERWREEEDEDFDFDRDFLRLSPLEVNANLPEPAVLDATYSGSCGTNLTWTLSNGVLTITGTGAMYNYEPGDAPWFSYIASIKSIKLPSGLTNIGNSAFLRCVYVETIEVPSKVTSIGDYAFYECVSLTSVTLPSSLTSIGDYAFFDCIYLPSVTIPANVSSIGTSAFSGCISMTAINVNSSNATYSSSDGILYNKAKTTLIQCPCGRTSAVSIPSSVTKIGESSFEYCIFVPSVTIPASVTTIENWAFDSCYSMTAINVNSSNANYCSKSGVLYNKAATTLIKYPGGKTGDFTVPSSVTGIANWAFYDSMYLPKVIIPSSVTIIGSQAFALCNKTEQIWFMGSAPTIRSNTFEDTNALAFYPQTNSTWTASVRQNYKGELTWVPCRNGVPVNPFTDVKDGKFFYFPVLWAYYHEPQVTSGTTDTTFSPNQTCTRAQIVTFLWSAFGQPEPTSSYNPFVDVKSDKYYYKAVLWAVEKGITSGKDATHFAPNADCSRAEVVTFIWNAYGRPAPSKTTNPFVDVKSGKYYYDAVLWAYYAGITGGMDATHFGVSTICTRGQVVTFLYSSKSLEKP